MPGSPSRASTTSPESSANAGKPDAAAAARALISAFSAKLVPVSSGSARPSSPAATASIPYGMSSSRISRSLPGLCVAITSRPAIWRCAPAGSSCSANVRASVTTGPPVTVFNLFAVSVSHCPLLGGDCRPPVAGRGIKNLAHITASFCRSTSFITPFFASASRLRNCSSVNGIFSAVPCTSTIRPAPVMTKLASVSASESSA